MVATNSTSVRRDYIKSQNPCTQTTDKRAGLPQNQAQ